MNDAHGNKHEHTEHTTGTTQRTHINPKLIQNKGKIRKAFNGTTGLPPLWRPNEHREREKEKRLEVTHNKGVRSEEAKERRRITRTIKRRIERQEHRSEQYKLKRQLMNSLISHPTPTGVQARKVRHTERRTNEDSNKNTQRNSERTIKTHNITRAILRNALKYRELLRIAT
jgi:hypothetical protein